MDSSERDDAISLEELEAADTRKLLPPSTDDDEDLPPAYDLPAPPKSATAGQVREYICEVLRRRGVASALAESISARWTTGTGVELREYPIEMYYTIFGSDEDVWAVYAAVKGQLYREKTPTKDLSKMARGKLHFS